MLNKRVPNWNLLSEQPELSQLKEAEIIECAEQ